MLLQSETRGNTPKQTGAAPDGQAWVQDAAPGLRNTDAMKTAPLPLLMLLMLGLAGTAEVHAGETPANDRPLNLSVPREPRLGASGSPTEAGGEPDLPYGSGYEARQRASGGNGRYAFDDRGPGWGTGGFAGGRFSGRGGRRR